MSKKKNTKRKPVTLNGRLKKYIFIALQALSGTLIAGNIFVYTIISSMTVSGYSKNYEFNPGINKFRGDYYDSFAFTENFNLAISDVLRFAVIRQQLEAGGAYAPNKIVNVGKFSHRSDSVPYSGPDAPYYLNDLLEWGISGVERDYKVFFSWEEYYDFIGNIESDDIEETTDIIDEAPVFTDETLEENASESEEMLEDTTKTQDEAYSTTDTQDDLLSGEAENYNYESFVEYSVSDNSDSLYSLVAEGENQNEKSVASLDTIKNKFLSADQKNLEDYVDNSEDYNELAECLRSTIEDLCSNYSEYKKYQKQFDINNTNIRFAVVIPEGRYFNLYSNVSGLPVGASESKVEDIMKSFGNYVYINKKTNAIESNVDIDREQINYLLGDRYSYAYSNNCKIYIAIDTTYPVEDHFYDNYNTFYRVCRLIPWMVLMCAVSLILFIALGSWLIVYEKKTYSFAGAKENLNDFDRLPIEISALFFIMLILILLIGESLIIKTISIPALKDTNLYFIPISVLLGIDVFVVLLFIYGFVRRIVCDNVTEGSIASMLAPSFEKMARIFRRTSRDLYDDSEIVLKVGLLYILFLIVNVFFVSQIVWGRHSALFVLLLIIFDFVVGIMIIRINIERKKIMQGIKRINDGDYGFAIDSSKMHGDNKGLANEVNLIGNSINKAVELNIKDEKLKADLITNVSHDIKTPLTSIINYVNLLKNENIDNENAKRYLDILEEKSGRLKQLTIDLVEASKITSGNITLELMKINFVELLMQTIGEFEEKFMDRGLQVITNLPKEPVYIEADPRRMWRVIENLFNNIYKYALENTRVYVDLVVTVDDNGHKTMAVSIKNVSKNELNIPADELTERFIRGDVSRSTEGSGLGLSIAKSLTTAHGGSFDIYLDGDLFKVTLTFDIFEEKLS